MSTIDNEIKTAVAKRLPPGDRWQPLITNQDIVLESLTEALEFIYQAQNITKYYIDAREGMVYAVDVETVELPPPPPPKTWSLYGDEE